MKVVFCEPPLDIDGSSPDGKTNFQTLTWGLGTKLKPNKWKPTFSLDRTCWMQIHHSSASPSVGLASCLHTSTGFLYNPLFLFEPNRTPTSNSSAAVRLVCPAAACVSSQSLCRLCARVPSCSLMIVKPPFTPPVASPDTVLGSLQPQRRFRFSTLRWRARWRLTPWLTTWPSGSGSRSTQWPWSQTTPSTTGAWRATLSQSKSSTATPAWPAARSSTIALTPSRSGCCSLAFQHR